MKLRLFDSSGLPRGKTTRIGVNNIDHLLDLFFSKFRSSQIGRLACDLEQVLIDRLMASFDDLLPDLVFFAAAALFFLTKTGFFSFSYSSLSLGKNGECMASRIWQIINN